MFERTKVIGAFLEAEKGFQTKSVKKAGVLECSILGKVALGERVVGNGPSRNRDDGKCWGGGGNPGRRGREKRQRFDFVYKRNPLGIPDVNAWLGEGLGVKDVGEASSRLTGHRRKGPERSVSLQGESKPQVLRDFGEGNTRGGPVAGG